MTTGRFEYKATADFSDIDRNVKRTNSRFSALGKGALVAGAGIATGVGLIGVGAFKTAQQAADLDESINALQVTFGDASDEVQQFGIDNQNTLKLTRAEYNQLASVAGASLQSVGISEQEAGELTQDLITRASDLASVYNVEVADALNAVISGLNGQSEPLRALGVNLTQNGVNATLLAEGLSEIDNTSTELEKTYARLDALFIQSQNVHGDAANTAESFTNQLRLLDVQSKELQTTIGRAFIPVFTQLLTNINKVAPGIIDAIGEIFSEDGQVADTIDDFINIFRKIAPSLSSAFSTISSTISGLASVVTDAFDAIFGGSGSNISETVSNFIDIFKSILSALSPTFARIVSLVNNFSNVIVPLIDVVFGRSSIIRSLIFEFIDFFTNKILPAIGPVLDNLLSTLGEFVNKIVPVLTPIVENIVGVFTGLADSLLPVITPVFEKVIEIVTGFIDTFTSLFDNTLGEDGPLGNSVGSVATLFEDTLLPIFENIFGEGGAISKIIEPFSDLFNEIFDTLFGNNRLAKNIALFEEPIQAFVEVLQFILDWWDQNGDAIVDGIGSAFRILVAVAEKLLEVFTTLLSRLIRTEAFEILATAATELARVLTEHEEEIIYVFQAIGNALLILVNIFGNLLDIIAPVVKIIAVVLIKAIGLLLDIIFTLISAVRDFSAFWMEIWTEISAFSEKIFTGIETFIRGIIGTIDILIEVIRRLLRSLSGAAELVSNIVEHIGGLAGTALGFLDRLPSWLGGGDGGGGQGPPPDAAGAGPQVPGGGGPNLPATEGELGAIAQAVAEEAVTAFQTGGGAAGGGASGGGSGTGIGGGTGTGGGGFGGYGGRTTSRLSTTSSRRSTREVGAELVQERRERVEDDEGGANYNITLNINGSVIGEQNILETMTKVVAAIIKNKGRRPSLASIT